MLVCVTIEGVVPEPTRWGVNSWFPGTGQIGIMTRELDQNLDDLIF